MVALRVLTNNRAWNQLPKQDVVGSNPIARSKLFFGSEVARVVNGVVDLGFQPPENPVAGVSLQLQAVLAA